VNENVVVNIAEFKAKKKDEKLLRDLKAMKRILGQFKKDIEEYTSYSKIYKTYKDISALRWELAEIEKRIRFRTSGEKSLEENKNEET
jgi:hypothetical protein